MFSLSFGLKVGFVVTVLIIHTTRQQLLALLRARREGLTAHQLGKIINIEA